MKKLTLLFILFLIAGKELKAQNRKMKKDRDMGLFVSGGSHAGLWLAVMQSNDLPYSINIDKTVGADNTIGIGYSHDTYRKNPILPNNSLAPVRENIRLRFCHFMDNTDQRFVPYCGGTAGISRWTIDSRYSREERMSYFPTFQFFAGIKANITHYFFNQTEIAIGPPYAVSTSFGFKF